MTNEKLFKEISGIDTDLVLEAAPCERKHKTSKRHVNIMRYAAVCAAFALIVAGLGMFVHSRNNTPSVASEVVANIYLDVNPGIEIELDCENIVVDVKAVNADGEKVIGDVDYTGKSAEETVSELVKSMVDKGYINDVTTHMLLTIESDADMQELKEKLLSEISIGVKSIEGKVIVQMTKASEDISEIASEYGITAGKAKLIKDISEKYVEKELEELAVMTITELSNFVYKNEAKTDYEYEMPDEVKTPEGWMSAEEAFEIVINENFPYLPSDVEKLEINSVKVYGEVYEFEFYYKLFAHHGTVTVTVNGITGETKHISGESGGLEVDYLNIAQANDVAIAYVKDKFLSIRQVIGTTGGSVSGIWHYVFEIEGTSYDNEEIKYTLYIDAQTGELLEMKQN